MEEHRKRWYKRGLGPRVDALEVALKALLQNTPAAEKNIRMVAESLRASSRSYGFADIFAAARLVEEASPVELPDRTRELIRVLRGELADEALPASTILLVGEHSAFMEGLSRELEAQGKEALAATTAAQAQQLLLEREIVFVVLDLFLPDQDGRDLLESLRSKPLTAAIPVIVIAPKLHDAVIGRQLVPDIDGYFAKPADPHKVAEFILSRLRRAHEVTRAARRDPLTGLLNRAAFCETFEHTLHLNETAQEPLSLALLELDGFHTLEQELGSAAVDQALLRVGQVLSVSFRATDIVARWSASQFAVLFPGEDQFGGMRAIEKAMQMLRRQHTEAGEGKLLPLTMSAGLTVLTHRVAVDQAIEEADRYLYQAKTGGGNPVVTNETAAKRRRESVLVFAREEIAGVLKQLLGNNGFDVMLVKKDPDAVLGELARSHCRLIALEEENNGQSGFDLLRRIRENPRFNRIPVVMLVANEGHAARALDLGANDYLLKPFTPIVFISRLRYLLTRGMDSDQRSRTLLIMDPDTAALIVAGTTLHKKAGFRVLLARSGREGLQRLRQESVDAVLLDPRFPDVGGAELIQRIADLVPPDKTPILLAASAGDASAVGLLGSKHIRGVIAKPYNLQRLAEEVSGLLNLPEQPSRKAPAVDEQQLNKEIQRILPPRSRPPAP